MHTGRWGKASALLDLLELSLHRGVDPDGVLRLHALGSRAELLLSQGLPDRAAPLVEAELAWAEAGAAEQPGTFADALGNAHRRVLRRHLVPNDHETAITRGEAFLQHALHADAPARRAKLLFNVASAHQQLERRHAQRPRTARTLFEQVLSLAPGAGLRSEARLALARLALDEERPDDARDHLDDELSVQPPEHGQPELAALNARWARVASITGAQADAAHVDLTREVDQLVATWMSRPPRVGGLGLLLQREHRELIVEAVFSEARPVAGADGPRRALERLAALQASTTLARRLGADAPTVDDLAALLPDGGGLLVYTPSSRAARRSSRWTPTAS